MSFLNYYLKSNRFRLDPSEQYKYASSLRPISPYFTAPQRGNQLTRVEKLMPCPISKRIKDCMHSILHFIFCSGFNNKYVPMCAGICYFVSSLTMNWEMFFSLQNFRTLFGNFISHFENGVSCCRLHVQCPLCTN